MRNQKECPLRESIEAGAPLRRRAWIAAALAALVALTGLAAVPAAEAKKKQKSVPVKVMTRNIFLGADLSPGLNATTFNEFTAANGAILAEVERRGWELVDVYDTDAHQLAVVVIAPFFGRKGVANK